MLKTQDLQKCFTQHMHFQVFWFVNRIVSGLFAIDSNRTLTTNANHYITPLQSDRNEKYRKTWWKKDMVKRINSSIGKTTGVTLLILPQTHQL